MHQRDAPLCGYVLPSTYSLSAQTSPSVWSSMGACGGTARLPSSWLAMLPLHRRLPAAPRLVTASPSRTITGATAMQAMVRDVFVSCSLLLVL